MKKPFIPFIIPFCLFSVSSVLIAQESESLRIALAGDAIISRKLSVYKEPAFLKMVNLLRGADAAFANLEMLFHDYESYPAHQGGGTYMRADPQMAQELSWAGFDLLSLANNHAGDYGVEGMRQTIKHVDQAGMIYAGVGESLTEAREAKYMETANGRIAFIACSASFPDHIRAGKSRGDMPSRPGINPLRSRTTQVISPEQMQELVNIGKSTGNISETYQAGNRLRLWGQTFELGDKPHIKTEPSQEDLEEIATIVRNAKQMSDIAILSLHTHQRKGNNSVSADFIETFAHAMIDAGADVVVGHGPHTLRGIEIYKGKPIFYSLNNFMFQNETLLRLPNENYKNYNMGVDKHLGDYNARRSRNGTAGFPARASVWESVIAVPAWKKGQLESIAIYPITLGFGTPVQVRGRPMLASEELGKKIIEDLNNLSKPYGTEIEWKEGIGIIKLSK